MVIHPPDHLIVVNRKEGTSTALAVEHTQKESMNWITASVVDMSLFMTDKN